jgi:hypothetical protein
MTRRRLDLLVYSEGPHPSVYLVLPRTAAGDAWLAEHISPDAQRIGSSVAVEHRFIRDIVRGAVADGLGVEKA